MKAVKGMRKKHNRSGFTMAEMLIVVAIIAVLSGVAFIAVQNHMRSMAQLERDAVAKEIFIAAQNHLTMAESQGYLNESIDYGTATTVASTTGEGGTGEAELLRQVKDVYYIGVTGGAAFTGNGIVDLMLPFGAIDETVRAGGSYIIRYQANPALVLDVFYCPKSARRYARDISGEYESVLPYAGETTDRKNYNGAVLGWYGGENALPSGQYLEAPTVKVTNAERLTVEVTDPNAAKMADEATRLASLKLIVIGETSGAQMSIALSEIAGSSRFSFDNATKTYTVILDDITSPQSSGVVNDGLHFADLNNYASATGDIQFLMNVDGKKPLFVPGENIAMQAVAYSNTALTNIAYSGEETTNSLFADYDDTSATVYVANMRHLENLDRAVSGLGGEENALTVASAEQVEDLGALPKTDEGTPSGDGSTDIPGPDDTAAEDLSWTGFIAAIQAAKGNSNPVKVYKLNDTTGTADNSFRPVSPDYELAYAGNGHSIANVMVTGTEPAGLFGAPTGKLTVSDLALYDFDITGSDAGALVGALSAGSVVTNVAAWHGTGADETGAVTATGSAGGLIGSMTTGDITNCAAALAVTSSGGDAGGLIGKATGGSVTGSYSGGHTDGGAYSAENYNVSSATGSAGGLVGNAGSVRISNSYSTCSAKGFTAGGLVGTATGTIDNCYATGLVGGATDGATLGAFAGSLSSSPTNCSYYEFVNPDMPAVLNAAITGIAEIDADLNAYHDFVGETTAWTDAQPYDAQLTTDYADKFNLKGIQRLAPTTALPEGALVATHYGDWPVPGAQVKNKGTAPSSTVVP